MGRWDTSIFGNDDAGDWAWELDEEGPEVCLANTANLLKDEAAGGILEMPSCEIAVAAAAVTAMLRGMPRVEGLSPETSQVLDDASWQPGESLCRTYAELLDVVLSDKGEISAPDVWGSEADERAWRGNVLEVKRFLENEAAHG